MCGIAGFYDLNGLMRETAFTETLNAMTDALESRGPDAGGIWLDINHGIGLGHRRLSIRDLSPTGNQPMSSSCGRFVIVYNGEVYCDQEIRLELEARGRLCRGSSDTEVIVEACAEWGVEKTVKKLIGMFAFALFDRENKTLILVRDRLGIKPLYWGIIGGICYFGSELKALRAVPSLPLELSRDALSSFMRHNYVPAPYSIYKNIFKLEPGHILTLGKDGTPHQTCYWDFKAIVNQGELSSFEAQSEDDILQNLDKLLSDAVSRSMVSDVEIGSLLSGGIDSSLTTALMAERSSQVINTFSIGFKEQGFDEAPYARAIAKHLGTNHHELYLEASQALDMAPKLATLYDEPFADSSQIPTALLCALTRKHVTVVLSGDGGDEVFAGYNRYVWGCEIWKQSGRFPLGLRKALSKALLSQPARRLDLLRCLLPKKWSHAHLGHKLHKLAQVMPYADPDSMYLRLVSHFENPDDVVLGGHENKGILWDKRNAHRIPHFLDRMQFLDTVTYLPDDVLTKVDRASMAVGLEVRVPLLDHRVAEFAWKMPRSMKLRKNMGKWALRQLLYKRVPRHLLDRPKMGFEVPLDEWIRGPLRPWAEHLLDKRRLKEQGFFNSNITHDLWEKHLNGQNCGYSLWNILMAQSWLDTHSDTSV